MATISQYPGIIDLEYTNKGYSVSFKTIHDGDLTGNVYESFVSHNNDKIPIGMTLLYNGVDDTTSITFILSAENSALLDEGQTRWACIETQGVTEIPLFIGKWMVYPI